MTRGSKEEHDEPTEDDLNRFKEIFPDPGAWCCVCAQIYDEDRVGTSCDNCGGDVVKF